MPTILQNHYVLAVHDLKDSSAFFIALGFEVVNKPPGWVFVAKDNCMVMLGECLDAIEAKTLGDHSYFGYLRVDNVDAYYELATKNGMKIVSPPESKPWRMREFGVVSPEGHRIMIGQSI